MARYRVTLEACIDGNPLKAWLDGSPPNDVWQLQRFEFGDDLDAAKSFIVDLDPVVTTHAQLFGSGDEGATWELLYQRDAGDDLDVAELGQRPYSLEPEGEPEIQIPVVQVMPAQGER